MSGRIDLIGQVFGELTVIDFAGVQNKRAYWNVRCTCGRIRAVRGEHLRSGHTTSCGYSHDPSYRAIHGRLVSSRGSATEYDCARCGKPAYEWAYRNGSPLELVEKGLRYSPDLNDYEPMCASHHRLVDAEYRLGDTCPQGHSREEYETRDKYGWRMCTECHRQRANVARGRRSSSADV